MRACFLSTETQLISSFTSLNLTVHGLNFAGIEDRLYISWGGN